MDILIGIVLIFAILFFMGFGIGDIMYLVFGVLGLGVLFVGGFFAVCLVFLGFSKRKSGVFLEIDEEGRFPSAVYDIEGERVRNIFPCEMIMKKKLYVPEKKITLLHCKLRKCAIDANALATIIVGSLIFIPASVIVIVKASELIQHLLG